MFLRRRPRLFLLSLQHGEGEGLSLLNLKHYPWLSYVYGQRPEFSDSSWTPKGNPISCSRNSQIKEPRPKPKCRSVFPVRCHRSSTRSSSSYDSTLFRRYTSTYRSRSSARLLCSKTNPPDLPVLTLYTKNPCPLCEEALEVLSPFLHQVSLEKIDITKPENKHWWNEYKYDIPVFHLNGKFLMKHRANVDVLLNALKNLEKPTLNN